MLCFSSNTVYLVLTFYKPSDSKNNDSLLLLFPRFWKMKAEYVL